MKKFSDYSRADSLVLNSVALSDERHVVNHGKGASSIEDCQLTHVQIDIKDEVNSTSSLNILNTEMIDCTVLTSGALQYCKARLSATRMASATEINIQDSTLRQCFIRLQPGCGLLMLNNDIDCLNIEGLDSFSHAFVLKGLFTGSRFARLLVANGHFQAIFYRSHYRNGLFRHSELKATVFNRCVFEDVRFHDSTFTDTTFSYCHIQNGHLEFVRCNFTNVSFVGIQLSQCRFVNCFGIHPRMFS
ncbi:hypothetical protein [Candidatus Pantoea formicae]|jgi:uncharacterized protein YjbI with pentapeptide repeats|uniref:hypothetical protein n=1 Tax=Candidatus Pantoea formicae TaxID=2608355 RepID=UPI003ED857A2